MSRRRALIGAALAALVAVPWPARAAEPGVARGLARSAWYWQARGREDKAADAWKQVLAADPDDVEALAALGGFDAREGRAEEARRKLERLEKINPGHSDVPVLRRQLALGEKLGPMLAEARRSVHEGRIEDGIARYRAIFGDAGPPGDLALEYYETVAGTTAGWREAQEGLRRLVRRAPGEVRFELALGKILTWRDETRREGIGILSRIARHPAVGKDATASWRQAILWLGSAPEDVALRQEYLKAHPKDTEITRRAQADRRVAIVREGFAALERGDLAAAERLFHEVDDLPDARLGLALVAQRQAVAAQRRDDLTQARALLERARRLVPGRPDVWEESLRSVGFFQLVERARADRAAGRTHDAEARLLEAIDAAPAKDRWVAQLALAELYRATRRASEAEPRYRDVLSAAPNQADALRGLTAILVESGRWEEAAPLNERLARVNRETAFDPGWLTAEIHRQRATLRRKQNDLAGARAELEAARRAAPRDPWALHDLAAVLLEQGAAADARAVLAELLEVAPDLQEARILEVRLLVAEGEDARALEALSRIPGATKDASLVALRRRLEVRLELPRIQRLVAAGERVQAERALVALERKAEDDPEIMAQLAVSWSRLGAHRRAVELMRSVMARAPEASRGARLEIASALLEAGDDAGVVAMLDGLERDASLSDEERRGLASLRIAHAVRLADRRREQGDLAAAFAALDPVVRDYPGDPRLLSALGRAHERAGDARRAHAAYAEALRHLPDDPDLRRGAVDSALSLGWLDDARRLAEEGRRRRPQDPRAHLLAARVSMRRGDDAAAMRELERAQALAPAAPPPDAPAAPPETQPARTAAPVPEGAPQATVLGPPPAPASPDAVRGEIAREMERVRERHPPTLGGGFEARERSGERGLGALLELRQEAEVGRPLGYRGRLSFRASAVELDAGSLAPDTSARFGSGGEASGSLRAVGAELRLAYEGRILAADVGTTPLGFPVWAVVGGGRVRHTFGPLTLGVEGGRRPITESVLSWAGVKDPTTGHYWGGVLAEGGRLEFGLEPPGLRLWAYGGLDRLVGFNVQENRRAAAGGGVQARLGMGPAGELRAGIGVAALQFDENLSHFTYGHGGYFSPRSFLHAGVPLGWRRDGRLHWEIVAEPGYHWFRQGDAPAFPIGPPPGTPEDALARAGGVRVGGRTEGFAFDGRAVVGLALSPTFGASLTVGFQDAPEFRELRGALLLRFGL